MKFKKTTIIRKSWQATLNLITHGNFGGITRQGRVFVALSVFYRYAGLSQENEPPAEIRNLVPVAMVERARVLGAAFRVAHLVSAARPGVLPAPHFRSDGRKLTLVFEHKLVDLSSPTTPRAASGSSHG